MSYKVSLSDIQELMLFYSAVVDEWKNGISSVREKELVVENSNNISGNGADSMKDYLGTVYSLAEQMLYEALNLFISKLMVYTESYYQSIDSADNARIQEKELNERYESLKKKRKAMQNIGGTAEEAVDKISDIIAISGLDISSQDEQIGKIITSLETLDQDINDLENKHLSEDFAELDTLLYRIESFLSEMKSLNKEFKIDFTPEVFAAIPSVIPLIEAMDNGYKAIDTQQKEVQIAAENLGKRLERQQKEKEERQKTADIIKIGVAVVGTIATTVAVATGVGTLLVPVIVGITGGMINAIGTQYAAYGRDTEKWDTGYIGKEMVKGGFSGLTSAFLPEGTGAVVKAAVSGSNSAIWGGLDEAYDQMACTGNITDIKSVVYEGAKSGSSEFAQTIVGDYIEDKVEKMPIGLGLDKYENPSNDLRHYIGKGIVGSTSKMASGIGERFTEATVESGFDIGKNLAEGNGAFDDVPLGDRYAKVLAFDELGKDFVKGGFKEVTTSYYKERRPDSKTGLTPIIQSELGNKTDPETGTTPVVQESLRKLDDKADYSRTASTPKEEQLIQEMEKNDEFNPSGAKVGPARYSSTTKKPLTDKPIEIEFTVSGSKEEVEAFAEQLEGQEEGLNQSTGGGYIGRADHFAESGRTDTGKEQKNYRLGAFETAVDEKTEDEIISIMEKHPNMSYEQARKRVNVDKIRRETEEEFKKVDALHDPDQEAGGDPKEIHGVGSSGANRSIGAQWSHGRAAQMYEKIKEATKGMSKEELERTRLNIRLKYTVDNGKNKK